MHCITGTSRGVRTFCLEDTTKQKAKSPKADRQTEAFTKEGKGQSGSGVIYTSIKICFVPGALYVSWWSSTTTEAVGE